MIRRFVPLLFLSSLLLVACGGTAATPPEVTLVQVTPLPADTAAPPTPVPPTAVPPTVTPEPTAIPEPTEPPPTATVTAALPAAEELAEKIDAFMNQLAEANRFSGAVLVARGDKVILSDGYGLADRDSEIPNTPPTRFRIGSMTKAFTAMAIMQLQEQGKLEVNDSICDYLSSCSAEWELVTIHHLLTHTSGIPDYEETSGAMLSHETPVAPINAVLQVAGRPLLFEPGSEWRYSNTGYMLLSIIIEEVSGQSYEAFLQEHIFDPLGMADTGYDHNRDDLARGYVSRFQAAEYVDMTVVSGAGALYSTVEDLFRWARSLESEDLVSAQTLEQVFTPHVAIEQDLTGNYGYGWFVGSLYDRAVIEHGGAINGYRSQLMLFPEDELTTIVLSNLEAAVPYELAKILSKWALRVD